ncbi:hypothetical protein [Dasania marina]|uniref:hypothetical protein n=1 Tax=Dasania marina TaxID=471499 RepID=UPI000366CD69|nr:hypothetical protein [Dasania marina]
MEIIETVAMLVLGALFGGFSVHFSVKEKLRLVSEHKSQRRTTLLEEVAEHLGKVTHTYSKYASLINEIGPKADRMSLKQQKELDELSGQFVDVFEQVSVADAKLLLLGEKRLQKSMKLYTGKMAQFRKQFYPGRYHSSEQTTAFKKELSTVRDQFYDTLSERYDQAAG